MELVFYGHDYKYAAEQMLLTLFPDQRPVYPTGALSGCRAELRLENGAALCRLYRNGGVWEGRAEVLPGQTEVERVRQEQHALKLAFYRAALVSGVRKPAWGALTGVKPGKLMARYLTEGKTAAEFAADYDVDPGRAALCAETARHTLAARDGLREGDIGLYAGIPFCPTRCAYCSFISNAVGKSGQLVAPYLEALLAEIRCVGRAVGEKGLRPVSLYFGGGTPTTLSAVQLDRLCSAMEEHFPLRDLREFTVEAGRPDTITAEKLAVLRDHGVTRVSVNPQTMSDEVLEAIGRAHSARDVLDALELVRAGGHFQVNMDLIAGLPRDTEAGFRRTLETVLSLAPENITVHTLAIKNGSRLAEHPEDLPGPEAVGRMVDRSMETLRAAGYEPYYLYRQKYMSGGFENVGWTKPGAANLYNILMMEELCPVIALGAGASTKLIGPDGAVKRRINPKYPKEYIERMKTESSRTCGVSD